MSTVACTIASNNYLPFVRVFARSFLAHHPRAEVWALIVDRPDPRLDYAAEPFQSVFAADLGVPAFESLAFRYSILELNTALKPFFLEHLHRRMGCRSLCYFDPDVRIFRGLGELYDRVASSDLVLIPHLTSPLEDRRTPSERDILLSGVYNLGFLGLSFNPETLSFLGWWQRRLHRHCEHAVEKGLFVDQRWMDLAPGLVEKVEILRHPGYNAAYWSLPGRRTGESASGWEIGGEPLYFFHFSGYDPRRPEILSRYQNRLSFADRPDLEPLFDAYANALDEEGYEEASGLPYGFGSFSNGVPIPAAARRALRTVDPRGRRWADPFSASGEDSYFEWLRSPTGDGSGLPVPRIAIAVWDENAALQQRFPDPLGRNLAGFCRWLFETAGSDRLPDAFLEGLRGGLGGETNVGLESARDGGRQSPGSRGELAHLLSSAAGWLTADAGLDDRLRPRVPRLAMLLRQRRSDVMHAFPDPLEADRPGFALWYVTSGRQEYGLPSRLVRPVLRSLPWRSRLWATLWWGKRQWEGKQRRAAGAAAAPAAPARSQAGPGEESATTVAGVRRGGVNVVGWVDAPTGVGAACRGTLAALEEAAIPHGILSFPHAPGAGALLDGEGELPFDVTLFHVNADMMETVVGRLPLAAIAGQYRIGFWFWELQHFPLAFASSFRHVDEVWAPSRFCESAFAGLSPVAVRWVPPCVPPPAPSLLGRATWGVPDGVFLFFSAFDALSVPERKNPEALLAAVAKLRGAGLPAHLLLKVSHAAMAPGLLERLEASSRDLPVTLLAHEAPKEELDAMMAACDTYVSLHRSEGLGLPLIEAMYLGKPVVATGYGGCLDFLDKATGWPVRYRLVALDTAVGPYPAGAVWAEPDVSHAASTMAEIAAGGEEVRRRVAAAQERVQALYSPAAAGRRLRGELERLSALEVVG